MEILIAIGVVGMLISGLSIIRLHFFSKFMQEQIERTYQARIAGDRTAQYPNIMASYDNLKWYDPFSKFNRLIVYEKDLG